MEEACCFHKDGQILFARYATAVDTGSVEGVVDCFAPDGTASYDGGALIFRGRAAIEGFFAAQPFAPSTHLIGNVLTTTNAVALQVTGSALVCVTRTPGVVTFRGVLYRLDCSVVEGRLRIDRLDHRATWQAAGPGGPIVQAIQQEGGKG